MIAPINPSLDFRRVWTEYRAMRKNHIKANQTTIIPRISSVTSYRRLKTGRALNGKKTGFHERVDIFLTGIIAFSTVVYVVATLLYVIVSIATLLQLRQASKDSGDQMKQMISAANTQAGAAQKIADASDLNAAAATKFSTSAEGINRQSGIAVDQIQGDFRIRLSDPPTSRGPAQLQPTKLYTLT